MAEAEEPATVTETKKVINPRVEIDTSPPFESVKEAVDHFGGGGPWIPLHMLRLAPNHHDSEVINMDKVEEQASQLEKDLIKKKQETLHVLQELDAAKRFVEGLKFNLMQEMSSFMSSSNIKPEAHNSARSSSWCPSASSGSISMELNQAKINLGKTTTNLAVIQASVESLNRKIKDEHNLLEKITERKAMDPLGEMERFYGSKMVPHERCLINDSNGSVQEPNFEAEQFKKMTEASKYEVMKAMSEIERTKTSIKMAEMRLTAARKMEEAAKAVEAIALAEKDTKSLEISSHKSDSITLSFEEYNALTHKAQQAEDSCRNKYIESTERSNQSAPSIMKKPDATRRRKKSLEEVMGREDYFDRRIIRGNGNNNYIGETIENEQKKFKNSRLQPLDEHENENESNLKPAPVYRSTISIGDILGRKLILQDDIVVGKHIERHAEREQVSLSQMLREQSGLILHPPVNSMEDRGAEKQYYTQRKKFGFIHISIPRQSKKKTQVLN